MRRTLRLSTTVSCALALLVLGACGRGGGTVVTYVNQKNPAETLIMEPQPSVYNHVFSMFHDLKLSGGSYTLRTVNGPTKGTYTYAVNPKGKQKLSFVFQPEQGKMWGVEVDSEQFFKDDHGDWKLQKAEARKGAQLVKVGG